MAIRDTSRKPFVEDNDTNIKIGVDLPIRRGDDKDGFFATTSTTIEAVKNNIRNLLQTEEGERLFQPNLGIGLRRLLFEQITPENLISIQDVILDKIEFWLPFVEVRDIQIFSNDNNSVIPLNEIRVKILFNIKRDPNTLDSVDLNFTSDTAGTDSVSSTTGGVSTTVTGGGY
jgi:phage baseplate assembly protein W